MTTEPTDADKKIIALSAEIMQDDPHEVAFQHIVLCHLGFPRSRTTARVFERRTGGALLRLEAGVLWNGETTVEQPLPYGSIPRLVMIAAISRAIQQKTRIIELGR